MADSDAPIGLCSASPMEPPDDHRPRPCCPDAGDALARRMHAERSDGRQSHTAPGTPSSAATSSPPASPSATPAASNPTAGAAAPEQALAALAAAILVGPNRKQLSKDRRQLLTFLRNAHTAHAHAITNPLPTPAPVKIGGMSLEQLACPVGLVARPPLPAATEAPR